MNNYITGAAIRALREKKRLTQHQLAEKLCVSDKAISKWETGKGFPDISLIEPLANTLQVSLPERSIKKREDSCSVMCGNPLVS